MIDALEAVGGDSSVLAHHAVAAGDEQRILHYAPAAAADAARSGSHREAVALYETALRFVGGDAAMRAACSRRCRPSCISRTASTTPSRPASRR